MVGRPQSPRRHSLCAGQRSGTGAREGAGRTTTRRDLRPFNASRRCAAAREQHDPNRVCRRRRSDRLGLYCEPGAAGRQYHRRGAVRSQRHRQMARDAQGGAPSLVRAAVLANLKTATFYDYYLRAAEAVAPSLAIDLVLSPVEDAAADVERAIESFARVPNGGLVVLPDISNAFHRDLIIALAARHRIPAVYYHRGFVAAGGLMSYGNDLVDLFRQAASYVDRILRGDKPADLPVQAATRFETVLNLKTAKVLGLTVPPGLLVAADEVIE